MGIWDAPSVDNVCWRSKIKTLQELQTISCLDDDSVWTSWWSRCNWPIYYIYMYIYQCSPIQSPLTTHKPPFTNDQWLFHVISTFWWMNHQFTGYLHGLTMTTCNLSNHENSALTWSSHVPIACPRFFSLPPAAKLVRVSAAAWFPRQIGHRQRPGPVRAAKMRVFGRGKWEFKPWFNLNNHDKPWWF